MNGPGFRPRMGYADPNPYARNGQNLEVRALESQRFSFASMTAAVFSAASSRTFDLVCLLRSDAPRIRLGVSHRGEETCHQPWPRAKAPGGVHRGGQSFSPRARQEEPSSTRSDGSRPLRSFSCASLVQTAKRAALTPVALVSLIHSIALFAPVLAAVLPAAAPAQEARPEHAVTIAFRHRTHFRLWRGFGFRTDGRI
jgi:hypothetical protein